MGAEARRELWDAFDVIVDDLAIRVLVLNLPATGQGLTAVCLPHPHTVDPADGTQRSLNAGVW
ncbi:TIGR02679 domain-containing protein [Streptomyces griseoluteus]|uniref:TIGR02679 domain-containing protein n=1 Tax=Streptomyces griseoluteus TaxID=29306 RepID=UPI003675AD09